MADRTSTDPSGGAVGSHRSAWVAGSTPKSSPPSKTWSGMSDDATWSGFVKNGRHSTPWSEPSTSWPSEPEPSPTTPWLRPGIIGIGANGGSIVSLPQDIKKANPPRVMDDWAALQLIAWAAGKSGSETTKAKLRAELCSVAAELAGPSPSPIERVLAETAATAWFAYRLHEATY